MPTNNPNEKPLVWLASAKRDLLALPVEVVRDIGHALGFAQLGRIHGDAVPMKGFGGASVVEIRVNFNKDTFRGVYTVRFQGAVYVLHVFQKKSKTGIATPKEDLDLITSRLKTAEQHHAEHFANEEENP